MEEREVERMKDRCLFKAKICNGEWVAGFLHCKNDKWYISNKAGSPFAFEVRPDTICQCTGLKDKNGKLIWENDIVAYWDTYSTESGLAEANCVGEVMWDDETISFQVTNRLFAESYEVLDECNVIGNIFDNPELINER